MTISARRQLTFDDGRWWLDTATWRGATNGLPALRWAPILEVDAGLVRSLLVALADKHIPARAEAPWPARGLGGRRPWRLSVDAIAYGRAEDILRVELETRSHAER
jgi:hypothetical protein